MKKQSLVKSTVKGNIGSLLTLEPLPFLLIVLFLISPEDWAQLQQWFKASGILHFPLVSHVVYNH